MSHFMGQNEGNFIFIVIQRFEETDIDTHIMSDSAERIETRVVIYKVIIGLFQDRWICFGNGIGKTRHDPFCHGVGLIISIDAILGFYLLHIVVAGLHYPGN